MTVYATLECQACLADFRSQMPLSHRGLLGSSLMFLVEQCPHCGDTSAYMRSAYRSEPAPARLSA